VQQCCCRLCIKHGVVITDHQHVSHGLYLPSTYATERGRLAAPTTDWTAVLRSADANLACDEGSGEVRAAEDKSADPLGQRIDDPLRSAHVGHAPEVLGLADISDQSVASRGQPVDGRLEVVDFEGRVAQSQREPVAMPIRVPPKNVTGVIRGRPGSDS
jgi:hypothetical protein